MQCLRSHSFFPRLLRTVARGCRAAASISASEPASKPSALLDCLDPAARSHARVLPSMHVSERRGGGWSQAWSLWYSTASSLTWDMSTGSSTPASPPPPPRMPRLPAPPPLEPCDGDVVSAVFDTVLPDLPDFHAVLAHEVQERGTADERAFHTALQHAAASAAVHLATALSCTDPEHQAGAALACLEAELSLPLPGFAAALTSDDTTVSLALRSRLLAPKQLTGVFLPAFTRHMLPLSLRVAAASPALAALQTCSGLRATAAVSAARALVQSLTVEALRDLRSLRLERAVSSVQDKGDAGPGVAPPAQPAKPAVPPAPSPHTLGHPSFALLLGVAHGTMLGQAERHMLRAALLPPLRAALAAPRRSAGEAVDEARSVALGYIADASQRDAAHGSIVLPPLPGGTPLSTAPWARTGSLRRWRPGAGPSDVALALAEAIQQLSTEAQAADSRRRERLARVLSSALKAAAAEAVQADGDIGTLVAAARLQLTASSRASQLHLSPGAIMGVDAAILRSLGWAAGESAGSFAVSRDAALFLGGAGLPAWLPLTHGGADIVNKCLEKQHVPVQVPSLEVSVLDCEVRVRSLPPDALAGVALAELALLCTDSHRRGVVTGQQEGALTDPVQRHHLREAAEACGAGSPPWALQAEVVAEQPDGTGAAVPLSSTAGRAAKRAGRLQLNLRLATQTEAQRVVHVLSRVSLKLQGSVPRPMFRLSA